MTKLTLRTAIGSVLLGLSALALTPAAHANIPEGAVVLSCTEVAPGFYSVTIFYEGEVFDVLNDSCPLDP
ncbi:hypothetical protein NHF45_12730 [Maricaulaceae bacterium NA33B04]|nr:hypothetical protein [Maricaulaceae bacterium NA33B04]